MGPVNSWPLDYVRSWTDLQRPMLFPSGLKEWLFLVLVRHDQVAMIPFLLIPSFFLTVKLPG